MSLELRHCYTIVFTSSTSRVYNRKRQTIPRLTYTHLAMVHSSQSPNVYQLLLVCREGHYNISLILCLKVAAIYTYTFLGCHPNSYNGVHYQ